MPNLIQQYTTALMRKMSDEAKAIGQLSHNGLKGQYREIFAQSVLEPFLSSHFGIGTGIIVNQIGDQSPQQDIIIYDRRILPPFMARGGLGVFPVESVLTTIEVKSILTRSDIVEANQSAIKVRDIATSGSIYKTNREPRAAIIGYKADSTLLSQYTDSSCGFLKGQVTHIWAICCVDAYSWLLLDDWTLRTRDGAFQGLRI